MQGDQVIRFIRQRGVVLESAMGLEASLARIVSGGQIRGSWWSHREGKKIYAAIRKARESKAILVCGLARGRITYIHRRLWPYFVRLAEQFPRHALDQIIEVHLPTGKHLRKEVLFPQWVPPDVIARSQVISEREAREAIGTWLERYGET